MDIRLILVPLLGTAGDEAGLKAAHALERDFGASVEGLFIHPDPREAVWRIGEGVSTAVMDQLQRALAAGASLREAARRHFEAALVASSGGNREHRNACWREMRRPENSTDHPDRLWAHAARLADLIVFGRSPGHRSSRILEFVLLEAGRPLLIVPTRQPAQLGARIVIAWNNTAPAARALCAAMPMLKNAAEVHVVTIGTQRTKTLAADELVEYLRRHGVDGQAHRIKANGAAVGRQLLANAEEIGADLLVMGAYGHSRLQDLLLGRVTRHALSHAQLPILMSH